MTIRARRLGDVRRAGGTRSIKNWDEERSDGPIVLDSHDVSTYNVKKTKQDLHIEGSLVARFACDCTTFGGDAPCAFGIRALSIKVLHRVGCDAWSLFSSLSRRVV